MTNLKYGEIANYLRKQIIENEYGSKYMDNEIKKTDIPKEQIYKGIFTSIFTYISAFRSTNEHTIANNPIIIVDGVDRNCTTLEVYKRLLIDHDGFYDSKLGMEVHTTESLKKESHCEKEAAEIKDEFFVEIPDGFYSHFVTKQADYYDWQVFIDKNVFLNYLWTMKNELEEESLKKEIEQIIYEYCEKENIILNDENFDYYDVKKLILTKKIRWKFHKFENEVVTLYDVNLDNIMNDDGGIILPESTKN